MISEVCRDGLWTLSFGLSQCHGHDSWLGCEVALRATSHTRLKAREHCNVRTLIGRKGEDCPSSLHTWRWRPEGPKKTLWMKNLHGVLHGGLWTRFHGLPEFSSSPPPRGGHGANSRRPSFFIYIFSSTLYFMINYREDSRLNSMTDKHHRVILSNWQRLRHITLNQILPSFSANMICNGPATWSILTSQYAWGHVTT